jgi:putative integral membrane protein (TIGR02587 family)
MGALLVAGLTFHYTMETWWLGWTLPMPYLLGFALGGLAGVVAITRYVGFHRTNGDGKDEPLWRVPFDFTQILLQSFVTSYLILLLIGVVDAETSPSIAVRLGLIEVVPLGFGAAMANRVFGTTSEAEAQKEMEFPTNVALFVIGALFISAAIAPTQEMELISTHMTWAHHVLLVGFTVALVYLFLYQLDFRGQEGRSWDDWRLELGTAFLVYLVGAGTAFLLLVAFGHFTDATVALIYQETVVLAFPAALGGAAAQVVV